MSESVVGMFVFILFAMHIFDLGMHLVFVLKLLFISDLEVVVFLVNAYFCVLPYRSFPNVHC